MIVFGHNNFLIKSVQPSDIGIPQEEGAPKMKFEIRQRYAHLFWIPFFPIGKIWGMKYEGQKDLYDMPENIKAIVKERVEISTPWYSFSLIVLALVVGAFFMLSEWQQDRQSEANFYNSVDEKLMFIDYPTTGDYYVFDRYETEDSYDRGTVILKVKEYDDKGIQFISMHEDLYQEIENTYSNKYMDDFDLTEANAYNPTYINKEDLKAVFRKERKESYSKNPLTPLLGYFTLSELKRRELKTE